MLPFLVTTYARKYSLTSSSNIYNYIVLQSDWMGVQFTQQLDILCIKLSEKQLPFLRDQFICLSLFSVSRFLLLRKISEKTKNKVQGKLVTDLQLDGFTCGQFIRLTLPRIEEAMVNFGRSFY